MAVCPNGHDSVSDDFCDTCGMRIGSPAPGSPQSGSHATGSAPASGAASSAWPDPAASAAEPCPRCGTPRNGQFCEACGYNFVGPRFTPTTASVPAPSAPAPSAPAPAAPAPAAPGGYSQSQPSHGTGGYSSSQPGPRSGGYSSGQPAPGSGGYSSAQAPPQAPPLQPVPSAPPAPASPSMSSFPYPQATWTAVVGADRAYYEQVQTVTGPEGAAVAFPSYYAERRFQLVGNQMRIGRRSVSRGLAPEIDLTGPPADPGISRLHAVLIATPDGNWAVLDPGSANGTLVNGSEIGVGDQVSLHDGDRINLGAWTAITVHRG
jgi:pSer/pThr/pTyr-binding forkhead associated (FHA) protein